MKKIYQYFDVIPQFEQVRAAFMKRGEDKLMAFAKDMRDAKISFDESDVRTFAFFEVRQVEHRLRGHPQGWLAWQQWRWQKEEWYRSNGFLTRAAIKEIWAVLKDNAEWLKTQRP